MYQYWFMSIFDGANFIFSVGAEANPFFSKFNNLKACGTYYFWH